MLKHTLLLSLFTLVTGTVMADTPSTHGMLIFGKEKIYLSHLPMFHNVHRYQVIMEVTLERKAVEVFLADQKQHPSQTVYTLVPEEFVLPDKVRDQSPFSAEVYRGHFERPGNRRIVDDTTVSITKIVHFHELNPRAPRPAASRYLLFGVPGEAFLAHFITGRPNFDHILTANISSPSVAKELGEAGIKSLSFTGIDDRTPISAGLARDGVEAVTSLYLEHGDLSH